MTQQPYGPPPGQYPPQPGYPGAPQQQYPPQGPPPGYGTPPPPQAQAFTPAPVFNAPGTPTGGGDSPAQHQLTGRLLIIRPTSIARDVPSNFQGGNPQDQITADIVVVDGPPIPAKINQSNGQQTPFADGPKVAPFFIGAGWLSGKVLTGQLEEQLELRGLVVGRLTTGTPRGNNKPPYILSAPTPQDLDMAQQVYARLDELKAAAQTTTQVEPQQPAAQPQYQPAPPPQQYQQPAPQPWQQAPVPTPQGPPPGYGQQPWQQPQAPAWPPPQQGQQ